MRVLWFTSTPSLYDPGKHHYNGGGWIDSLEMLIRKKTDIKLAISFFHDNDNGKIERNGTVYYPIKRHVTKKNVIKFIFNNYQGNLENKKKTLVALNNVIKDYEPDVIQVFGTEGIFASIQDIVEKPIIIHLQGIINPYFYTYFPPGSSKNDFILSYNYFFKNLIGTSPVFGHKRFTNQAEREFDYLRKAKFLMGRTLWDKKVTDILAPQAQYFHLDEVLRPLFYEEKKENYKKENSIKIISTLSPTTYKGIDIVLKVADLLQRTTNISFEWQIAGLESDNLLLTYFKKKLKINNKIGNVKFMGRCSPDNLVYLLKTADIFIHPSYIDNSPNSVCEAQMLGLPVIACNVGGVSTLVKHEESGVLVPSNGIYEIVYTIKDYDQNPERYFSLGKRAREIALERHDREKIANRLNEIYQILKW